MDKGGPNNVQCNVYDYNILMHIICQILYCKLCSLDRALNSSMCTLSIKAVVKKLLYVRNTHFFPIQKYPIVSVHYAKNYELIF